MGADTTLVTGAAAAYKDRSAAGLKESGDLLMKPLTDNLQAWKDEKVQANKDLKRSQDQAQAAMTRTATEMSPQFKALGKEAYDIYREDVKGLRAEMDEALRPPRDEDAIMDINSRLQSMGTSAATDKDAHEALIEGHESSSYDLKAMDPEGITAHDNFLNNPTKKFVRTEDGASAYSWDVLDDNGQPVQKKTPSGDLMTDISGQPIYETQTYTLDELNEFTATPQTESGMVVMDYVTEKKKLFNDTQGKIKVEDVRKEISKAIPKDAKALRSWAKSNPTENSDLDIYGYLMDHPLLNKAAYKDLGVEDKNGDGKIDENDLVSVEDRELLINAIMNADDPDITHEVLTDIYTSVSYNTIHGKENEDYTPNDKMLMGDQVDTEAEGASIQQNKLNELKKGKKGGESDAAFIDRLELTEDEVKNGIYDPDTNQDIRPASEVAKKQSATNTKTAEEYKNMVGNN